MKKIALIMVSLTIISCGPIEPEELKEATNTDTSHVYLTNKIMAELELQEVNTTEESSVYDYGKQFTCPNCGEPFDGHECENCHYTENR